jgi:hypothetical protein
LRPYFWDYDEVVAIELTDDERKLLWHGLAHDSNDADDQVDRVHEAQTSRSLARRYDNAAPSLGTVIRERGL